ncbi:hypothetical protein SLA2020_148930 [Shorea laevis]
MEPEEKNRVGGVVEEEDGCNSEYQDTYCNNFVEIIRNPCRKVKAFSLGETVVVPVQHGKSSDLGFRRFRRFWHCPILDQHLIFWGCFKFSLSPLLNSRGF